MSTRIGPCSSDAHLPQPWTAESSTLGPGHGVTSCASQEPSPTAATAVPTLWPSCGHVGRNRSSRGVTGRDDPELNPLTWQRDSGTVASGQDVARGTQTPLGTGEAAGIQIEPDRGMRRGGPRLQRSRVQLAAGRGLTEWNDRGSE